MYEYAEAMLIENIERKGEEFVLSFATEMKASGRSDLTTYYSLNLLFTTSYYLLLTTTYYSMKASGRSDFKLANVYRLTVSSRIRLGPDSTRAG